MPPSSCPSREALKAFATGQLGDADVELLGNHLDACTECESTVAMFEAESDTFLERFRVPSPQIEVDEPEFHDAVARIRAFGREPSAPGGIPHDLGGEKIVGQLREYRLLSKLGEGGMGTVYTALHTRLNRLVALKMLPADRVAHGPSVARFAREIEAVGKLDHPNIVRAFDAGDDEDMHYLVMELVDGVDLHQLVKRLGPLSVADACEVVRQAALGLQHAYQHGLVHRDVKPSNLLLSRDGTVKVLDLGLALLQSEPRRREELTGTGQVMGTLDYIAPEQASDSHQVDIRADVYALGCTLFKLLTGRAPFADDQYDSALKKLMAHAQTPPPALKEYRKDVPDGLAELLQRMLAKDPGQRPSLPAEVAAALEPLATGADLSVLASQVEELGGHDAPAASAAEIPVMLQGAGIGSRGVVDTGTGDRGPRGWLLVGWALIATAFVCLGLTIAAMMAAFHVVAEGGENATGLALGIAGSVRYLAVGGPAFLAGLIVLIVTYLRGSTARSNVRSRGSWATIAGISIVSLIVGMALGQSVVRIQHENGRSPEVVVTQGNGAIIDEQKDAEILPQQAADGKSDPVDGVRHPARGESTSDHAAQAKSDSKKLLVGRLDGMWRLDRSSDAERDAERGDDGEGTRPDISIAINTDVIAKFPTEFKNKSDERGISILTAGYMTYKRKEQLFAITDWNNNLILVAFSAEAPHAPIGDAMIKFETAPQTQDDKLFISEGYEDNEPFKVYRRLRKP